MFPELYILRHGQTEWNAEHRIQGSLDSPLTDTGRAQAAAQRKILGRLDLAGFQAFASPQGRAHDTAKIALEGLLDPIVIDPRLSEIHVGDWEGRTRGELDLMGAVDESSESALDLYDHAPGGEGFVAFRARCASFLNDLEGPAVLVSHGMTSRMLRLILLDMEIVDMGKLPGGQGIVYHLKDGRHEKLE